MVGTGGDSTQKILTPVSGFRKLRVQDDNSYHDLRSIPRIFFFFLNPERKLKGSVERPRPG